MDKTVCCVCSRDFGFLNGRFGGECRICHGYACKEHYMKRKEVCTADAIKFDIKEE